MNAGKDSLQIGTDQDMNKLSILELGPMFVTFAEEVLLNQWTWNDTQAVVMNYRSIRTVNQWKPVPRTKTVTKKGKEQRRGLFVNTVEEVSFISEPFDYIQESILEENSTLVIFVD